MAKYETVADIIADRDALRMDAKRYRWIRSQTSRAILVIDGVDEGLALEAMDEAVDIAMAVSDCDSYAINHHLHGRDGSKPDLCDVCYWRGKSVEQGLTLVTLCDMVLGEDAPKRDDETLVRAVRVLLSNVQGNGQAAPTGGAKEKAHD